MKPTVLLVDDEEKLRSLLKRLITLEGYDVRDVGNLSGARQILKTSNIDIVLCDVKLPDGNGVDFTGEIKGAYPYIEVILLTAYGNIPDGVKAIKNGAFDYLVKGDDNGKIIPVLSHLSTQIGAQRQIKRVDKKANRFGDFDSIIGKSDLLYQSIQLARKVAATDTAVLLTGETGTGKEVFAQAIHYNSKRTEHQFIALNCSAFSKELLESELFGHKAGAFTGAIKDKKGLVEEAKGGTLFLDEIGEMPLDLQPKLLRLLATGDYIRVGDTKELQADVRIIAATNRTLKEEIQQGRFRDDLYYRIAVFNIELPPLRERSKDIPLLVEHYLQVYTIKTGKSIKSVSRDAMTALMSYEWPGNVRELKNVVERAVILEDSDSLCPASLPIDLQHRAMGKAISPFHLAGVEKLHIQKTLAYTKGNKAEAARLMNIGLATLYRKIDEYELK